MIRLKELLDEFNYSQYDMESLFGISRNVIANIKNGRCSIDHIKLSNLCKIFQVTMEYFLGETNEGIYVDVLGKKCLLCKEKFLLYKSVNKIIYVNGIRTLDVKSIDEIELVNGSVPFVKLRNEIL